VLIVVVRRGYERPEEAVRLVVDPGGEEQSSGRAREVAVAIPVGPPEAVRRLQAEADRVVCLLRPPAFVAVGEFYEDFHQTGDEEVVACLERVWMKREVS